MFHRHGEGQTVFLIWVVLHDTEDGWVPLVWRAPAIHDASDRFSMTIPQVLDVKQGTGSGAAVTLKRLLCWGKVNSLFHSPVL